MVENEGGPKFSVLVHDAYYRFFYELHKVHINREIEHKN